ncbi:hypothetical protein [Niabella aurantiaca]|uniref:hypothetical protein n=1 Tax=Niabella aurantiaca TaxID=379900 RepID=UPI00037C0EB2|nr:hypothetical protein [Niabella aurantiaca]
MDIKRHFKKFYSIYIACLIVIASILNDYSQNTELKEYSRYTAGKVLKISPLVKAGVKVDFSFNYAGESFKSVNSYGYGNIDTSSYYLIKFSTRKPKISIIYLDQKLNISNDSEIPYSGWENIPEYLLIK